MVAELHKTNTNLYEADYNLWVLETVAKLKNKDLDNLDWENLIEEVEDLSRRDKRKLKSLLIKLCEHLLKLKYWDFEYEKNKGHWQSEVRNFRQLINMELEDSPSLRPYLEDNFTNCYHKGRLLVADRAQLPLSTFSEQPIITLEQVLDEDWLP